MEIECKSENGKSFKFLERLNVRTIGVGFNLSGESLPLSQVAVHINLLLLNPFGFVLYVF